MQRMPPTDEPRLAMVTRERFREAADKRLMTLNMFCLTTLQDAATLVLGPENEQAEPGNAA